MKNLFHKGSFADAQDDTRFNLRVPGSFSARFRKKDAGKLLCPFPDKRYLKASLPVSGKKDTGKFLCPFSGQEKLFGILYPLSYFLYLCSIKLIICSMLCHKLFMVSGLDDTSVIYVHDPVAVAYG